jgi:hypothetical protein
MSYLEPQAALKAELGFVLHPCGSEYYGYQGDDYDYFVSVQIQDVPDALQKVEAAGFREFTQYDERGQPVYPVERHPRPRVFFRRRAIGRYLRFDR